MLVQLCAPWRGAAAKGHAQCPCPGRRTRRRHGDQRLAWLAAALAAAAFSRAWARSARGRCRHVGCLLRRSA